MNHESLSDLSGRIRLTSQLESGTDVVGDNLDDLRMAAVGVVAEDVVLACPLPRWKLLNDEVFVFIVDSGELTTCNGRSKNIYCVGVPEHFICVCARARSHVCEYVCVCVGGGRLGGGV